MEYQLRNSSFIAHRWFTRILKAGGASAALILCAVSQAQPLQQVHPNPDCQFFFTLTSATSLPTGNGFDNRQQGCTTWSFSYVNSGFSGLTVTVQSAANNAGSAGTWNAGFAIQQNTISGSNAATSTTGGFWWVQGTNAFVRVNLSGLTGTGVVNGAVFGWRIPNAGGQSSSGSIVCLTGDVAAGSGGSCTTATVQGIESVPFCSGYTPTNGQFVQYTTGKSPNPCYTAASGSGGSGSYVLVEEHTAANSATLNFTTGITSTYDTYVIQLVSLVPATNNTDLTMVVSTNGGSSYDTTSGHYAWSSFRFYGPSFNGQSGSTSDASIGISGGLVAVPNSGGSGIDGAFTLWNPLSGSLETVMAGQVTYVASTIVPSAVFIVGGGNYTQTTAINALQFAFATGNITSGTIRMYGISH